MKVRIAACRCQATISFQPPDLAAAFPPPDENDEPVFPLLFVSPKPGCSYPYQRQYGGV